MEWGSRRALDRSFGDRILAGSAGQPRWARSLNTFDVDSRPTALSYPHYSLGPELVPEVPHITPALYPSDPPLYPDAGRLVLLNPEPSLVSAPYLPPAGSHVVGLNNTVLAPSSGYVPLESHLTPLNPLPSSFEFQDPLTRPVEYGLPPSRFERHMQLSRRSALSQSTLPLRRRGPPQESRLPRQAALPRRSLPTKKPATAPLAPTPVSKKIKKLQKKGKKEAAATAASAAVAATDKSNDIEAKREEATAAATPKAAKPPKSEKKTVDNPVSGMIFGCNESTEKECKRLQLFALPASRESDVLRVIPGSKLFLFNFDTKELSGVYEAVSAGAMNIRPDAFKEHGSFPAQVRNKRIMKVPNLSLPEFKKAIKKNFYSGNKFKYELTAAQVDKLIELFSSKKGEVTA